MLLLYASLFHQCIAGPIVRYTDISRDIMTRRVRAGELSRGMSRFAVGLAKKAVLANGCAAVADSLLAAQGIPSASVTAIWLGNFMFMLQIYLDFSAYSDMAIGMGLMCGLHYKENFNYPYMSDSVTDFWRRWHISLSSWFRDYVYIPLGGNRCKVPRQIFNLAVVWFLTGLWHGASWNYVLWGVYYGVLLCLEKFVYGKYLEKAPKFIKHLYLCFIVVVGFTVFAIEDFSRLLPYLGSMFTASGGFAGKDILFYLQNYGFVLVVSAVVSLPVYPLLKEKLEKAGQGTQRAAGIAYAVVFGILFIVAASYMVADTYNPFLYFRF
jgi:alginate O-acetyltransferase complex protein AlgI